MTTAHCTTAVPSGPDRTAHRAFAADWLRSAAALALRLVTWPARVAAARAAMTEFARMSDHDLKDIGLTRQDVRDATGLVLDDDPTQLLAERAASRTRSSRSADRRPNMTKA